jgi:uncharacterized membrane protein YdbT with pleckstrin-like domain
MSTERIQLEPGETILALVRKHWFILFSHIMGVVVMAVLPLFGYIALTFLEPFTPFIAKVPTPLLTALYSAWLIMMWMSLFGIWTNYYLDVWTVTDKRLITVDQHGLFNRHTGSFRLERLQDINVDVHGILATLLKFGNLQAETASEDRNFVARGIPDPQSLKSLILAAADKTTFIHSPQQNPPTVVAPTQVNDGL